MTSTPTIPMLCKTVEHTATGSRVEWRADFVGQYTNPAQWVYLRGTGDCPYTAGRLYTLRMEAEAA